MTAEVAVLNRRAVALAADSAVTVRAGRQSKVFNSANKLLMLAEDQPVGVMVYGNADLLDIPWETVLKEYRKTLGDTTRDHLEVYATDLLAYLQTSARDLFDESQRNTHSLYSVVAGLSTLRKRIDQAVMEHAEEGGNTSEQAHKLLTTAAVKDVLAELERLPYLSGFDDQSERRIRRTLSVEFDEIIQLVFAGTPTSTRARRSLRNLAAKLMVRAWDDPSASGIVVAGFGRDQMFPSLRGYRIYGYLGDKLRCYETHNADIKKDNSAYISGFAQSDMVTTFMEGADPSYIQFGSEYIKNVLDDLPIAVLAGLSLSMEDAQNVSTNAEHIAEKLHKAIVNALVRYRREHHAAPVLDTVSTMPADELAALAEALVNLTSLKRRTRMVADSVGGPVDVALISKGDGFIWVERKHYFSPELNPRFVARYNRNSAHWRDNDSD